MEWKQAISKAYVYGWALRRSNARDGYCVVPMLPDGSFVVLLEPEAGVNVTEENVFEWMQSENDWEFADPLEPELFARAARVVAENPRYRELRARLRKVAKDARRQLKADKRRAAAQSRRQRSDERKEAQQVLQGAFIGAFLGSGLAYILFLLFSIYG